MSSREVYEALLVEVCGLERAELLERLTHFRGALPLDFSAEYLAGCDTDRMRHLLVAAMWRCFVKQISTGVGAHA